MLYGGIDVDQLLRKWLVHTEACKLLIHNPALHVVLPQWTKMVSLATPNFDVNLCSSKQNLQRDLVFIHFISTISICNIMQSNSVSATKCSQTTFSYA